MIRKPLKVAVLTPDFVGPLKNGGVGTVTTVLAELLAEWGHDVTVVFCPALVEKCRDFDFWRAFYSRKGIDFVWIGPDARAALDFLASRKFDVIHYHDMRGLGYQVALAKKEGAAFQSTLLCAHFSGPTGWAKKMNGERESPSDLTVAHLERGSIEMADVLFLPTKYALSLFAENKWKSPKEVTVSQFPYPDMIRKTDDSKPIDEIVFFGRLETRKGLKIFCDALDLLSANLLAKKKITFLGNYGFVDSKIAWAYLEERSRKWEFDWQVIWDAGRNEALEYLRSGRSLAVIPSLSETMGYTVVECIGSRIPFIAAGIPPFKEIVDRRDHGQVFFENEARAIADKVLGSFAKPPRPARFAIPRSKVNIFWRRWHDETALSLIPKTSISMRGPTAGAKQTPKPKTVATKRRAPSPMVKYEAAFFGTLCERLKNRFNTHVRKASNPKSIVAAWKTESLGVRLHVDRIELKLRNGESHFILKKPLHCRGARSLLEIELTSPVTSHLRLQYSVRQNGETRTHTIIKNVRIGANCIAILVPAAGTISDVKIYPLDQAGVCFLGGITVRSENLIQQ